VARARVASVTVARVPAVPAATPTALVRALPTAARVPAVPVPLPRVRGARVPVR
jgi:hypothetical protein